MRKIAVDLGMLADIDEVCAAYREWGRVRAHRPAPPLVDFARSGKRLKRAMGRLNRVRLYWNRRMREQGKRAVGR